MHCSAGQSCVGDKRLRTCTLASPLNMVQEYTVSRFVANWQAGLSLTIVSSVPCFPKSYTKVDSWKESTMNVWAEDSPEPDPSPHTPANVLPAQHCKQHRAVLFPACGQHHGATQPTAQTD
jgi:hypothetical protein